MKQRYVIDGSNVCYWANASKDKKMSISPLLTIAIALMENGDDFICIFDATILHALRENAPAEHSIQTQRLIRNFSDFFCIVPGGARADATILDLANSKNASVISNDFYRDYRHQYSWISSQHSDRLIQGVVAPMDRMVLEKWRTEGVSLRGSVRDKYQKLSNLCIHARKNIQNEQVKKDTDVIFSTDPNNTKSSVKSGRKRSSGKGWKALKITAKAAAGVAAVVVGISVSNYLD